MGHKKSSKGWLQEHAADEFVKRAQKEGYRSRAIYKLAEIDKRDRLFHPGITVVDLGAAPGSWAQYAHQQVGSRGRVLALDILPMESLGGIEYLQGDFTQPEVLDLLLTKLNSQPVDLVISDMAPNISGITASDQARAMFLAELTLDFAKTCLRPGGQLLVKVFQGEGYSDLRNQMQRIFGKVVTRKPRASRSRSREVYLLGKDYQGL